MKSSKYEPCDKFYVNNGKAIIYSCDSKDTEYILKDKQVQNNCASKETTYKKIGNSIIAEELVDESEHVLEDEYYTVANAFVVEGRMTEKTRKNHRHSLTHRRDIYGVPPQEPMNSFEEKKADIEYIERMMEECQAIK